MAQKAGSMAKDPNAKDPNARDPKAEAPSPGSDRERSRLLRIVAPLIVFLILAVAAALVDLAPSLSHVHVRVLSGAEEGNYHAIVDNLARAAAGHKGEIVNVTSAGSGENVARLLAAARSCDVQFALVQADVPLPKDSSLEVIGSFAKAESIFFLGKDADKITEFSQLRGLKIAVGPEGGGAAMLLEKVFGVHDLNGLGVKLSHPTLLEGLDQAQRGEVDLAAVVMDEDAVLVDAAVRERGLQIADFSRADVIARRFPYLRHGRIGAGQFDAVKMLPPTDKRVLRVGTLLVGNGCASRSQVIGLLRATAEVFPDFLRHNKESPPVPGARTSAAARSFYDAGGPEVLDEYLPRVADVMPAASWVQVVMAVSVLFNLMGVANRFLLWRVDAGRVKAEQDIAKCFGPSTTLGDIARAKAEGPLLRDEVKSEMDKVIKRLEDLAARSRRYSVSVLCPMGGEMAYRYQESLIHEALAVLRAFVDRWEEARSREADRPPA